MEEVAPDLTGDPTVHRSPISASARERLLAGAPILAEEPHGPGAIRAGAGRQLPTHATCSGETGCSSRCEDAARHQSDCGSPRVYDPTIVSTRSGDSRVTPGCPSRRSHACSSTT